LGDQTDSGRQIGGDAGAVVLHLDPQAGWSAVEAGLLFNGVSGMASTAAVRYWIDFLQRPVPGAWYRAHNASIVVVYLENRGLVALETPLERFFMDVALLRVLYAHSLLVRPTAGARSARRDRPLPGRSP
jgi:hypothetical protein